MGAVVADMKGCRGQQEQTQVDNSIDLEVKETCLNPTSTTYSPQDLGQIHNVSKSLLPFWVVLIISSKKNEMMLEIWNPRILSPPVSLNEGLIAQALEAHCTAYLFPPLKIW